MKNIAGIFACCLVAIGLAAYINPPVSHAQQGAGVLGPVEFTTTAPSGNCTQSFLELVVLKSSGAMYTCSTTSGNWAAVANTTVSPTFTGTAGFANITASGTLAVTGATTAAGITASGTVQGGGYKSSDGTAGATATCTVGSITTFTVKNGLVTACS